MDQGIEVKGLTVRFGNVTALEQVNLTLGENRIYGLLGRNGGGEIHIAECHRQPVVSQ